MNLADLTIRQQRALAMGSALALAAVVYAETAGVRKPWRRWLDVPGGEAKLGDRMGAEDRNWLARTVDDLIEKGLMQRVQTRLLVKVQEFHPGFKRCEICCSKVAAIDGAKLCPTCLQLKRREWKGDALEMWCTLKAKGWGDMKIANHISLRLKRSMWGYAEEEGRGAGSGDGEGVIPALVAARAFPVEMLRLCAEARGQEEVLVRRGGEVAVARHRERDGDDGAGGTRTAVAGAITGRSHGGRSDRGEGNQ